MPIPRMPEDKEGLQNEAEEEIQRRVCFVVDVLCLNPACRYRDEAGWFVLAQKRAVSASVFGTCGSSGCLTSGNCSIRLLSPLSSLSPKTIRRRLVLQTPSVL